MTKAAIRRGGTLRHPRLPDFYNLVSLDTTDSTNADARRLATDGAPEGTFVQARSQGAGRGRRGRDWASPPGNMYASLILRPDCPPATAAQISFFTPLAIHDAINRFIPDGNEALLKWPNDVLINREKVAGILLESHLANGNKLDWLVVGMGINIDSFPDQVERPATSLRACGADVSVTDFTEACAEAMLHWYKIWQKSGFAPVREAWLRSAWGQGGPVEVRLGAETFHGVFEDLDETGALVVSTPQGTRLVTAGDVFPGEQGET